MECGVGTRFDLLHLIALTKIDRVGPVISRKLIDHFGDVKAIFKTPACKLRKIPKVGDCLANAIRKPGLLRSAERELEYAEKHNVKIRSVFDEGYPWMLKHIHGAPLILYQKGKLEFNEGVNIAIVGTRRPSSYGRSTAERIAGYLSERGVNVVSGLAYGIDGEAHQAVLKDGGKTTAVLGHGFKSIYPREHAGKAERIVEEGALLTEFHSDVKPDGRNFPSRNRIISGICHATIVVEASEKGGALITANMAFQQNREVYAVPGDLTRKTSIGCNQLIRNQIARIFTHPQDVLNDLEPMLADRGLAVKDVERKPGKRQGMRVELNGEERLVFEVLGDGGKRMEDVANVLDDGVRSKLHGIMLGLEFKGVLRQEAGGIYVRC